VSLRTWIAEFAPDVANLAMLVEKQTWIEATKWSIRKWTGLLPKNLKKHDVIARHTQRIVDGNVWTFEVTGETCPLCLKCKDSSSGAVHCERCPLYRFLGRQCDMPGNSPYDRWQETGAVTPMINSLTGTLEMLEKEEKTS
jgi:hypothetical protein